MNTWRLQRDRPSIRTRQAVRHPACNTVRWVTGVSIDETRQAVRRTIADWASTPMKCVHR